MSDEKNGETMHVVELVAENVKRLRAVRIRPDGHVVIIGGRNAQGKSSTLDAIEMALAGKEAIPPEPVRRGARRARIVLDLGSLVVERTFTPKGSQIVVRGKDGEPQQGPQGLLDRLCASIAFDPVEVARMEPKKQDALLKKVLGLNFDQLDIQRAALFEQRKLLNRDIKSAEVRIEAMPMPGPDPRIPREEISITDLAVELHRVLDQQRINATVRANVEDFRKYLQTQEADLRTVRSKLAEARDRYKELVREESEAEDRLAEKRLELQDAEAAEKQLVDPDPGPIKAKMASAEELNRKFRAIQERDKLLASADALVAQANALTEKMAAIDDQKRAALAAAKFPVPGLGFDDVGPTLNGVPLEQASDAEKLRLSVAIGAALHPQIRVMLVRSGSLLDDDSMRLLADLAKEQDLQLWIERVSDRDPSAIIIEDGAVRGDPTDQDVEASDAS